MGEFWQPLLSLFDVTMDKHILKAKNRELILDDPDHRSLLNRLVTTNVRYKPKWMGDDLT